MAIFKKNIWTIFYILLTIALLSLFVILYNIKKTTEHDFTLEQESLTKISANSIDSVFLQYEMILDILGHQLTQNNNYQSLEKSREILDSLLELNSTIAAFGLAKPDGQLYITSSNLKNIKNLPNLSKKRETKESFAHALEEDVMVIGRTYFHKTLQSLIIPIRKTIRAKDNQVLAVMTAGINVNKAFGLLSSSEYRTLLLRDFDYFLQLTDERRASNANLYKKAIPNAYIQGVLERIENKQNQSVLDVKKEEKVVTLTYRSFSLNKEVLSSVQYMNRYELWMITQIPYSTIKSSIYMQSSVFVVLFIVVSLTFFYLFRFIHSAELRKQKALEYQANHDYLTRLNNRLYLSEVFSQDKLHKPFSLLFIDMDNFKSVNDNYGHEYGDKILKEISYRLQSFKKEKDELIRYSGDEFMFITYSTQKENIKILANKIIERLSEPYNIDQYQFILGASIGISQYPLDGKSFDEIKRYADIAMYESKKDKNTFTLFEDSIKHKYLKYSLIEQELKTALQDDEVYMMYQPQVTSDGKLYGVEALVRWENKKLGFVPPDEFIKIAETTGSMVKLGKYIMKTSMEEMKDLQILTGVDFQLSLNISVKQFMEKNFYNHMIEMIGQVNFSRLHITLEVTENVFIEDIDFILELLNKIKKEKINISLDDFGTGYSSLSLLRQLPIDELKVDKMFVDDILHDDSARSMIESIISIGKNLDVVLLAEGVETLEQKELLESYGCKFFQGYYYSKPLKKDDLFKYIMDAKEQM